MQETRTNGVERWLTGLEGKNVLKNIQFLVNRDIESINRCAFMARFD
jgi:hypothetical protein